MAGLCLAKIGGSLEGVRETGFKAKSSRFRVWGVGLRGYGLEFRVMG